MNNNIVMDSRSEAIEFVIKSMKKGNTEVERIKLAAARRFKLEKILRNSEIIARLSSHERERLLPFLRKRPMRTASGVTPIAVMIRPEGSCPYSCIYCPTGLAAKSYTGFEPAALRARQEDFDPVRQVRNRLKHYEECGHPTDKCEIILMGGTFLRMPSSYKRLFVKGIYDGLNGKKSKNLQIAKKQNETVHHRAIGLTIETRPDVCGKEEINEILEYGATRVELGVQHPDDRIYKTINRGHGTNDVIVATSLLKDSAFKVLYHLMPGLPGSNKTKDISMVKRLFSDERFRPDMLKIYPALVMSGTGLELMANRGEYEPYNTEEAADVISEFYRHIPSYVRVMRVQRDIPTGLIGKGVHNSNLRQFVEEMIKKKRIKSREIRSREIGIAGKGSELQEFKMKKTEYNASGGKEVFLSFENRKSIIAGFLRLRIGNEPFRKEIDESTALIRELHVYGSEMEIGKHGSHLISPLASDRLPRAPRVRHQEDAAPTWPEGHGGPAIETSIARQVAKSGVQHSGLGSDLLHEAERLASEHFDKKRMIVISGVGAREYYKKQGYMPKGPYMAKKC